MKCLNAFCFAKRKQLGQIFLLLFIWWIYSVLPKETSIGRAGKIKNINRSLQVIIKNPQFIMTVYLTFLQGNLFDKIGLPFHSKMSLHTLEFKHTVNKQLLFLAIKNRTCIIFTATSELIQMPQEKENTTFSLSAWIVNA